MEQHVYYQFLQRKHGVIVLINFFSEKLKIDLKMKKQLLAKEAPPPQHSHFKISKDIPCLLVS